MEEATPDHSVGLCADTGCSLRSRLIIGPNPEGIRVHNKCTVYLNCVPVDLVFLSERLADLHVKENLV